ncbi:MAG: GAF domain-containing protein [Anaerolineae bacterium]|nr:GAF domain-containing protein [Anaerolineae bacterium]
MHQVADALCQAAILSNSGQGPAVALHGILEQLHRVIGYHRASISTLEKQGWQVVAECAYPSKPKKPKTSPDCSPHGHLPAPDAVLDRIDPTALDLVQRVREPLIVPDLGSGSPPRRPGHVGEPGANGPDVPATPLRQEGAKGNGSWLGTPLFARGQVVGVMSLIRDEPESFSPQDVQLAMAFASQAAVVVENNRLLEAERARAAQLRLLADLSQQVLSILDPDALLDYAVHAIQRQFGYSHVDVFLTDAAGQYVVFQASSDDDNARLWHEKGLRFRVGEEGITGQVAATGEPFLARDVSKAPCYLDDSLLPETRSELVVPIKAGERVIGVLDLNSKELDGFGEEDLFVAQGLADQLALGLENARLFAAEHESRLKLQSIQATATALSAEMNPDTLPEQIVVQAAKAFKAEAASLMLWNKDESALIIRASYGLSPRYVREQSIPRERAESTFVDRDGPVLHYVAELAASPLGDRSLVADEELRSVLTVPLACPASASRATPETASRGSPLDRLTGILNIYSKGRQRAFEEPEIELAHAFASQAAVTLANAQWFAAEGRRRREAETLQAATQALSGTLDLQQVFEVILSELQKVVPYDSATVQQLQGTKLTIIGGRGFPRLQELMPPRRRRGRGKGRSGSKGKNGPKGARRQVEFDITATNNPNREVIQSRAPVILDDAPAVYEEFKREPHSQVSIRSWLGVPLLFGDRILGMLALDRKEPNCYTQEHARLAMAFAAQAAIAIENARLHDETQQRLSELALLFETSAALSTSLDMDTVLQITAERIATAMGSQGCAISAWEPDRETLVLLRDWVVDQRLDPPGAAGAAYRLDERPASRQALVSRQPLALHASRSDVNEVERELMLQRGVSTKLMVPMIARDKVVGLLELLEAGAEREFLPNEINLCQTLANQAAAALDNARLFQETTVRAREMAAVAAVGQAMTTLELDDVLNSIAENALEAVGAEVSSVYLLDEKDNILVPRSVRGSHHEELSAACFELGEGTIGWVAQRGEPLLLQHLPSDETFSVKVPASLHIRNTLTVPLPVKGEVIGTLEVCNKLAGDEFTLADQRLLTAFAAQASIAIENARLYRQVSHHLEEVQILNQVAGAATSTLRFEEVIRRSMAALLGKRNFERVNILLLDEARHDLWLHPALTDMHAFPQRAGFRIPLDEGITGWCARNNKPLRVGDVRQEPRYVAGYPDTLSEICVPLRSGQRVIGILDVQSHRLHAFSESDERLLTTLAGQLSTIIENSRLFAEAQQRVRELTAVMQVSQAINQAEDLDTVMSIVLDEAFNLMGSEEGSIILIDPPGSNRLRIVAERGLGREVVEAFNTRPVYSHEGTYKHALRSGQIVEIADTSTDPDFLTDVGSRARSLTNVPLMTERGAIGLIAVDGVPRDETTRRLLLALAGMAAVAIDRERLHGETANRLAEVSTLYTLATQIASSLSLTSVLETIVTILRMTLDCRSCSIFLLDATSEYLQLEAGSGPSSTWKGIARMRVGEGASGRAITERRSIYVPDTRLEADFFFFGSQIRSLLVVPLIVRNKPIGTLSIDDVQPNAFDDEVRLLTIAAAQAAVAIENVRLYESLQKSYEDLEQAYDELRQLDKMKSELIQNVSHELRTPLTFIKGYVELLQDGEMGELSSEQQAALTIVSTKAEGLSRLVDDIISMQQAGREQMQFAAHSLAAMGRLATQAAQASAQEAGIELIAEIEDVPSVMGDWRRLGQVFDNLIQNAIKFSDPGGKVVVRVRSEDAMVRVEVQDWGIGIAPEQQARIWERFYQVDGTTTRRFGGTGLGLAIVKQIVEAHRGFVGVESALKAGSLFYFAIPAIPANREQGG